MFELAKVKPDYRELKGVMFVVAQYKLDIPDDFKHLSKHRFSQKEKFVYADPFRLEIAMKELKVQGEEPLEIHSLNDVLCYCRDYFDGYDLGLIKSDEDWNQKIKAIRKGYCLEYELQKYDTKTDIDRVSKNSTRRYLLEGLYRHLNKSIAQNDLTAQMRAEIALASFLHHPKYGEALDDLVLLSGKQGNQKLVDNRIQFVLSLAEENFPEILQLQRSYLKSSGKI